MKQPIRKYYYGHFWTYYYDYYSATQKLPYQNKKSCWLCNILQAFMSFIILVTKYIPMSCTVWLLINMKYFPIHKYYYILLCICAKSLRRPLNMENVQIIWFRHFCKNWSIKSIFNWVSFITKFYFSLMTIQNNKASLYMSILNFLPPAPDIKNYNHSFRHCLFFIPLFYFTWCYHWKIGIIKKVNSFFHGVINRAFVRGMGEHGNFLSTNKKEGLFCKKLIF